MWIILLRGTGAATTTASCLVGYLDAMRCEERMRKSGRVQHQLEREEEKGKGVTAKKDRLLPYPNSPEIGPGMIQYGEL